MGTWNIESVDSMVKRAYNIFSQQAKSTTWHFWGQFKKKNSWSKKWQHKTQFVHWLFSSTVPTYMLVQILEKKSALCEIRWAGIKTRNQVGAAIVYCSIVL